MRGRGRCIRDAARAEGGCIFEKGHSLQNAIKSVKDATQCLIRLSPSIRILCEYTLLLHEHPWRYLRSVDLPLCATWTFHVSVQLKVGEVIITPSEDRDWKQQWRRGTKILVR